MTKLEQTFKEKELHKAALNAFIKTSFEIDKIVLAISIAILGYFVNYAVRNTKYLHNNVYALGLMAFIGACFLITIGSIMYVFIENKRYLKRILNGDVGNSTLLEKLDNISLISFMAGIVFSVIFSVFIVFN